MRLTSGRHAEHIHAPHGSTPSAAAAVFLVVLGLLAVFALDRSTGSAPVQHLYYVPIILAAARFGAKGGVAAPLAAILLYHAANPRLLAFEHQHWDILQVVLFAAVGLITARLTDDNRRLRALANTDDLTGLHNLRSFERRLAAMAGACRIAGVPLAVLVLDVDRLKALNDEHGHLAGAEAVRTVGWAIASHLPVEAVSCRYGGDEFVIAIPSCTEAGGRAFANGIRHAVYTTAPVLDGQSFPARTLSVSVGVACRLFERGSHGRDDVAESEALFRAADRALYQAKRLGRNHVCVA